MRRPMAETNGHLNNPSSQLHRHTEYPSSASVITAYRTSYNIDACLDRPRPICLGDDGRPTVDRSSRTNILRPISSVDPVPMDAARHARHQPGQGPRLPLIGGVGVPDDIDDDTGGFVEDLRRPVVADSPAAWDVSEHRRPVRRKLPAHSVSVDYDDDDDEGGFRAADVSLQGGADQGRSVQSSRNGVPGISSSGGGQGLHEIKHRLKALVAGSGLGQKTSSGRLRMRRSSSNPEGLDSLGVDVMNKNSRNVNNNNNIEDEDDDDDFGFRSMQVTII